MCVGQQVDEAGVAPKKQDMHDACVIHVDVFFQYLLEFQMQFFVAG